MPSDRIAADPRIMGGTPCIRGTRIPVATVVAMLAEGIRPDEILADFPQLTLADLEAAASAGPAAGRGGRD